MGADHTDQYNLLTAPVDYLAFCLFATAMVVASLIFDWAASGITVLLQRNDMQHAVTILSKVLEELTIMGFMAFLFMLALQLEKASDVQLVTQYYVEIDIAHLWIFAVGLLYAVTATAWLLIASWCTTNDWYRAHIATREVGGGGERDGGGSVGNSGSVGGSVESSGGGGTNATAEPITAIVFGSPTAVRHAQFKVFREFFLHTQKNALVTAMGAERYANFNYARYLDNSLSNHFAEALEVDAATWILYGVLLIFVMLCRIIRYGSAETMDENTALTFIWPTSIIVAIIFVAMNAIGRAFRIRLATQAYALRGQIMSATRDQEAHYSNPMQAALEASRAAGALEASQNELSEEGQHDRCCYGCVDIRPCSKHAAQAYWTEQLEVGNVFAKTSEFLFLVQIGSFSSAMFDGFWQVFNAKPDLPQTEWWLACVFAATLLVSNLFILLVVHPNIIANFVFYHSTTHLDTVALDATIEDMVLEQVAMDTLVDYIKTHLGGRWQQIFAMYDHSKTGTIENQQLYRGLNSSGVRLEYSQFCRLWRTLNPNQDKYVTMEEFEACYDAEIVARAERVRRWGEKEEKLRTQREKLNALASQHSSRPEEKRRALRSADSSVENLVQLAEDRATASAAWESAATQWQVQDPAAPPHGYAQQQQPPQQRGGEVELHAPPLVALEPPAAAAPLHYSPGVATATLESPEFFRPEPGAVIAATSVSTTAGGGESEEPMDVLSQVRANIAKRRRRSSMTAQAAVDANATLG